MWRLPHVAQIRLRNSKLASALSKYFRVVTTGAALMSIGCQNHSVQKTQTISEIADTGL
jgi:hypothetical protein